MMIQLEMETAQVMGKFEWVRAGMLEDFRDASFAETDFGLRLEQCWRGPIMLIEKRGKEHLAPCSEEKVTEEKVLTEEKVKLKVEPAQNEQAHQGTAAH
jgi:hypothetical protein